MSLIRVLTNTASNPQLFFKSIWISQRAHKVSKKAY